MKASTTNANTSKTGWSKLPNPIKGVLIFLFWMLIWELAFLGVGQEIYFPSPSSVILALSQLVLEPSFWVAVLASVGRVLLGLILSLALGVTLGILCAFKPLAHDLIQPFVTVVRATPVISFIIIALVWLKSSMVPVFICILMCFPVIWTAVVTGFKQTDYKLLEMARAYRVQHHLVARKIYWPSLKPYVTSAIINALGLGWKVSVAAEVLSHPLYSIGNNIYSAKAYMDSSALFAWTVVVVLLSYIFEVAFVKMVKEWT